MKIDCDIVAEIFKAAREKGISQKALAGNSGISEEAISRMKKRGSGQLRLVDKLAQAAGVRLSLTGAPTKARLAQSTTFRDKYAVALAWSNQAATDDILIRRALVRPKFQMLLDAAVEFGIDRLQSEWRLLKKEGAPETLKISAIAERILGHINDGHKQAAL